jgi:hypothetical protein
LSDRDVRETMPNFQLNQAYRFKMAMHWLQDKKAGQQQAFVRDRKTIKQLNRNNSCRSG